LAFYSLRFVTLLLFAERQDRQCTCDVVLRGVRANICGVTHILENNLKVAVLHGYGKTHRLWEMLQLWQCAEISHWS